MSDIIEEKEIPVEEYFDSDEFKEQTEADIERQKDNFAGLRALKGHKLEDGGYIDNIKVTIIDKKTKKKRVIKI